MKVKRITAKEVFEQPNFSVLADNYAHGAGVGVDAKPNIEAYLQLEKAGRLKAAGAFNDEGELVGVVAIVITPHLHYSIEVASVETLWLEEGYRQGTAGLKLLAAAERMAKSAGCGFFRLSCPSGSRQEQLFDRLYTRADTTFLKILER